MGGRELINFSTYSYLGFNGDPQVSDAAAAAAKHFGTSAAASRLVSGEQPPHRELERGLADFLHAEDCITFVSGHTTNVSTVSALLGPKDLVLHDRLIHNSILQGTLASGAHRLSFPHNDITTLNEILTERRRNFEKVLIVVEGIYSMDGDMAPLPELIKVKRQHKAILMVDEAHSVGVAGKTGRGLTEHFGIPSSEVDILMGTLSKALCQLRRLHRGFSCVNRIVKIHRKWLCLLRRDATTHGSSGQSGSGHAVIRTSSSGQIAGKWTTLFKNGPRPKSRYGIFSGV